MNGYPPHFPALYGTAGLRLDVEPLSSSVVRLWLPNNYGLSLISPSSDGRYAEAMVVKRTDRPGDYVEAPGILHGSGGMGDPVLGSALDAEQIIEALRTLNEQNKQLSTVRADADGQRWHFAYAGGSYIKIRQENGRPGDWEYNIGLDYYGLCADRITAAWFNDRAAEWITDRNADLAAGLYA